MYTIYEEHIEVLEETNERLQKRVVMLEKKIKYYQKALEDEEE